MRRRRPRREAVVTVQSGTMLMMLYRQLAALAVLAFALTGCAGLTGPTGEPAEAGAGAKESAVQETGSEGEDVAPEDTAETARAEAEAVVEPESTDAPRGFTRSNLYPLLVADLASRRGDLETALQGYMASARATRDPRVAERATRVALYARRDDLALEAAQRWLEVAPDNREAHSVAARLYLRTGRTDDALAHLRRVLELSGPNVEAGLGEITALTTRSSNPEAALEAMRWLRRDYGAYAVVHYAIGDLSAGLDRPDEALDALDRALDIDPSYNEARVLRARIRIERGEVEAALADLDTARERFPGDRDLALGVVRLLVETGRDSAARSTIRETFEQFGDDGFAVYSLSLLAMQIGAWDDARVYLERLLAMEQRTSTAHYYLARIAHQEGDCAGALRHYIKVGRGDHRFDSGLQSALCMAELGRADEARLHLDRMYKRYDEPRARVRVATTRARVEHMAGDPERALAVLNDAVEQYPDQVDLRYSRALTAAEQDRFELARADLEYILEQEPDNARALNALGYMLANRNLDLQRARDMIERALAQNPEDAATIDSMGWVLYRQGEYRQALEYLREAWELDPDAEIAAHLGEVLWALDRRDEARRIWAEARELSPDSEILRETVERLTR